MAIADRMYLCTAQVGSVGQHSVRYIPCGALRTIIQAPSRQETLPAFPRAPVHALEYTRSVINEQLGRPLEQIFDEFQPEPVASGSVAQ
eukprot:scaffold148280_cov41-Prasinocladus_malaysianus.AAC.2